MRYTVFDIETDGLLETVTLIHCLSYKIVENGEEISKGSLTDYNEIIDFITNQETLVGHNITRYDIPVMEKILEINVSARLIDTLALSWYLYPLRLKHGLELWGDELGVAKPVITDWQNLAIGDYIHRCESDVEINTLLYSQQLSYLLNLYSADNDKINNLINYLGFKLECAREQEEVRCKIDVELVRKSLAELTTLKNEKVGNLILAMPRDIKFKHVSKPNKMYKKDESLSVAGLKWLNLLAEQELPEDYDDTVMVQISDELGNPGSTIQLKNWLNTLGWEPITFEYRKNKAGEIKQVPQVYAGDDGVCPSIVRLFEIEPALQNLDMLSLINHRIGIFDSYLKNMDEDGYVVAHIHGFTNTLRMRHRKPIVNLPKVFKFYGEQIRGAIIAPNDSYTLCGSDMCSLEDTTKQHYMYFFDPKYVEQMRVPGFDPHLDIAVLAGLLTEEQAEAHKRKEEDHSQTRGVAKVVNFSGIYGAGPAKIAQTSGMSLAQAQALHKTYWQRNKSVKQIEKSCEIKCIGTQMWQRNPVSGFWYSLRYLKDKFSTLNQGTGVYVFDLWVREVRSRGLKVTLQYHDEVVLVLPKGKEEEVERILHESIQVVNEKIKLNVPLAVDVQFGSNYAKIH